MKRIFIQIASYRDNLLFKTIKSAIKNASCPERLFFGICLQDTSEVYRKLRTFPRTKVIYFNYTQSQGIGWARATAQELYDGQEYSMQIDSHMKFNPYWDEEAIATLELCPSKKAIFSQFCPDWRNVSKFHRINEPPSANAAKEWDKDCHYHYFDIYPHYLHITQSWRINKDIVPMQHAFICAHFIFGPRHFWEEVPIDPQIGYFYEENSMTLRAWTSGWDIYCPMSMLMRHTWHRNDMWDEGCEIRYAKDRQISIDRFLRLIGVKKPELNKYTLGIDRTLDQYYKFSGVDFVNQKIEDHAKEGIVNVSNI